MAVLLTGGLWFARRIVFLLWTVLNFPGVLPFIILALLYGYGMAMWQARFAGVWYPAFPKLWTSYVIILVTLPVFATIQLFWLLGHELVKWLLTRRRTRKHAYSDKSNWQTAEQDQEEYALLSQTETADESHAVKPPPSNSPGILSIRSLLWWTQILVYSTTVILGYRGWTHYENEQDIRWRPALRTALAQHPRNRAGNAKNEKIFIAANFYNNHEVLPYWTNTLLDVISYLGPDNVAVSIVESNSDDQTPELLRHLD